MVINMAKDIILVVDDDELNIDIIASIFEKDHYRVESCNSGKEALAYLTKNHKEIAVILIDLSMPGVDGGVLLKVLNAKNITKMIPVVVVTAETDPQRFVECYENGAADIITKPFISVVIRGRINNIIDQYNTKIDLEAKVNAAITKLKVQNSQLHGFNARLIEVLSTIVEFRNLESGEHIKRIKKMTRILTEKIVELYGEEYNLKADDVEIFENASAVHDIGKIVISDTILLKPGRLTADEFEVIKSHTTMGCEVFKQIEDMLEKKYTKVSRNIIRHHHERYDGKGYPDNLVGENIPIEAQIVSIIDAYEALVGERIYRDAFDPEEAYNMIMNGECGAFSKKLLEGFSMVRPELEKVAQGEI